MIEFGAIKNAASVGRASFFTLYIYFIKLGGVNRKGFGKYFPNREKGLGGIGGVWGLDRFGVLAGKSRFLRCASLGSE